MVRRPGGGRPGGTWDALALYAGCDDGEGQWPPLADEDRLTRSVPFALLPLACGRVTHPLAGRVLASRAHSARESTCQVPRRDNARVSDHADLRSACQTFVASAFAALSDEHVLPTPRYHAHMAVGRDYFGDSVMTLAEFTALEALLDQRYAERFAEPLKRKHAEFATTYIFGVLEACIVRCAQAGDFTPSGPAVEESIDELLTVLGARTYELVCARSRARLVPGTVISRTPTTLLTHC